MSFETFQTQKAEGVWGLCHGGLRTISRSYGNFVVPGRGPDFASTCFAQGPAESQQSVNVRPKDILVT
jgi:hypothetical protein